MKKRKGLVTVLVILGVLVLLFAIRYGRQPSFAGVDLIWDFSDVQDWFDKVVRLPFKEIPSKTPIRYGKVDVTQDIMVPMRDGVRLSTDVYLPRGQGPFPVILTRLPYGKQEYYCYIPAIGRFWAHRGYAYVAQDVRGKFDSEGVFDPFVHEMDDAYDTLEWISQQPWSNDHIGMMGESYYGYTTWAGALSGHPNLQAIAVSTTSMDIYRTTFRGGAFVIQTMGDWAILMDDQTYQNDLRTDWWTFPLESAAANAGLSSGLFTKLIENPVRNEVWDEINLNDRYADIHIPVLHFGGWYDVFLGGTLNDWQGMQANSPSFDRQWLILGPWDHEYTPDDTRRVGKIEIPDTSTVRWDAAKTFFDYYLMGIDNGLTTTPKVRYFTIGDNEWQAADRWPAQDVTYTDFYLHNDQALSVAPPASDEPADSYVYDPLDPVDICTHEYHWMLAETLQDRARLAERADVLVYDTAPLENDIEITGPILASLYASSSAVDTDFTVTLVDVFPDGYAHLIQEGILRASYRDPDQAPSPIEPGQVYPYTIDLWATSYVVKAGHIIRVEVSSSNFNCFDRNPNTGEPFGTAVNPIPADQRIFHTVEYPSHIKLPLRPR